MLIGWRMWKTGLAVTFTVLLSNLLQLENPFFAVISAVIAMQATISDSLSKGIERLLGSMVGVVVGLIFVYYLGNGALVAGLGITLMIFVYHRLGWEGSMAIAVFAFASMLYPNLPGENYLLHAQIRLVETSLGIVTAWLINAFVLPPKKIIGGHDHEEKDEEGNDEAKSNQEKIN